MARAPQTREVHSFGPFRLVASERLLTRDGAPVKLSARALDILIALLSRPNEVVGKKDLLARVWPDSTVEEGSLRFHIAGLRRALGDGKDGARYIATLNGRGYCFVAPYLRSRESAEEGTEPARFPLCNLPGRLAGMVGRDDDVLNLSSRLNAARIVTIVGAGGVGKTTVAVAVGHHLLDSFAGAVLLVDIGMQSDPHLVPTTVAAMLGLPVRSEDATPGLVAYLRNKRILLILDTCEHLIEALAMLTSRIVADAPHVHILATSREPLQVEGEHVYRLETLACPPDDPRLTAAAARTFPATQLFVERAVASGARLDFSDADAAIVVNICRKLDGVALAIELAARRVGAYGLQQTAALLDQHLTLLWVGPRTAPPRQRTLQATLDWSYGLLSEPEREVLRRLAVFVGHFTLDAALAVVTSTTIDQAVVFAAIDSLVAKSMIATVPIGAMMRYRLLDTTRAYVLGIPIENTASTELAVRHASYYRRWLEQNGSEWPILSNAADRMPLLAGLNNVRAALEWCFGADGDTRVGIELAAAAAPVFLSLSLLTDCHRWSERAVFAMSDAGSGSDIEMNLHAALAMSLMFTRGNDHATGAALARSLAIAEGRRDTADEVHMLALLHLFHMRIGEYRTARRHAERISALAATVRDPAAVALAHALLGCSLHHSGELGDARAEFEAAQRYRPLRTVDRKPTLTAPIVALGLSVASSILARNLWLQGHPLQAMERVHQSVRDAESSEHLVTLMSALTWAVSQFSGMGALDVAEQYLDRLISHAETYSLSLYFAVARGFKGKLAIQRGDAEGGIDYLRDCVESLSAARHRVMITPFSITLAQGLAAAGRAPEGLQLIEETIRRVETSGDFVYMPELLRVKGGILSSMPEPRCSYAEQYFVQSLELSRRHGARAWELRAAMDYAELLASRGDLERASEVLQAVFQKFSEGRETADLKAAGLLLARFAAVSRGMV